MRQASGKLGEGHRREAGFARHSLLVVEILALAPRRRQDSVVRAHRSMVQGLRAFKKVSSVFLTLAFERVTHRFFVRFQVFLPLV